MKRRIISCVLLLCCMLCFMLSSCGKEVPLPAESDVSAVSAEESTASEPNDEETQKLAADLLSAFLAGELSAEREDGVIEWIASERVQEIREQVKAIGKPFLTEETVLQIAEAVAAFYMEAEVNRLGIILPEYDTVAGDWLSPSWDFILLEDYEERYNVILAYTLYLLTPPKYAFSENEVVVADVPAIQPRELALSSVYLALAGEYGTWRDALAALQAGTQGVILNVAGFVPGMQAPNFSFCWSACALLGPDFSYRQLLLENVLDLSDPFLQALLYKGALANYVWCFTSSTYPMGLYERVPELQTLDGFVYVPVELNTATEIRNLTQKATSPVLTTEDVELLLKHMYECVQAGDTVLLLDVDGTGTGTVLRPEELEEYGVRLRATAYLADLFTPLSYRFTDLTSVRGTYYALAGEYSTPEEALDAFAEGEMFLLYTEDGDLYFINGSMDTKPLMSSKPYWQGG